MKKGVIYLKIVTNFIIFIFSLLFIIFVLPILIKFFWPFVIAWLVALIAEPLVRFFEKKFKIVRKHSTAIIISLVLIIITTSIYFLMLVLVREVISLAEDLPIILESIQIQISKISEYLSGVSNRLPSSMQNFIGRLTSETDNIFDNLLKNFDINSIINAGIYAKGIVKGVVMIIITIIAAYFIIVSKEEIVEQGSKIIPQSVKEGWKIITDNFRTAMGGYFIAQFKIMLVVTVIVFIGLAILRVEYLILLTIIIAILDFLPVLGAGGILWPWAIIDMISGNYGRAIGLIVIYIIVQIVRQVLQPKMVADSIGISPLSTLIFMFVGYRLYGVMGMIFGIPVGMILVNMYRIGIFNQLIRGAMIIISDINEFRKY